MEYKGNAIEKVSDAEQTIDIILRILQTSNLTTEDLMKRLTLIKQDLENAKMYINLI